jgi:hypothetical protein
MIFMNQSSMTSVRSRRASMSCMACFATETPLRYTLQTLRTLDLNSSIAVRQSAALRGQHQGLGALTNNLYTGKV